jgi:hypothetical protein
VGTVPTVGSPDTSESRKANCKGFPITPSTESPNASLNPTTAQDTPTVPMLMKLIIIMLRTPLERTMPP